MSVDDFVRGRMKGIVLHQSISICIIRGDLCSSLVRLPSD